MDVVEIGSNEVPWNMACTHKNLNINSNYLLNNLYVIKIYTKKV